MSRRASRFPDWSDPQGAGRPAAGDPPLPSPARPPEPAPPGDGVSRRPRAESGAGEWELFLLRLRYREGRLVRVAGNTPILLDDPEVAWVVFSGHADVFAVPVVDGRSIGARRHLFRAEDGTALLGIDPCGGPLRLLVSGTVGTQIVRVKRANLERLATNPEYTALMAALLERWIDGLSAGLPRELPPRDFAPLRPGEAVELPERGAARAVGGVVWVSQQAGRSWLMGRTELPAVEGTLPLSRHGWLEAAAETRLAAMDTAAALGRSEAWADLDRFHALALAGLTADAEQRERDERERLGARAESDRARLDAACSDLATVLAGGSAEAWDGIAERDPLLAACRLVGRRLGVAIRAPRLAAGSTESEQPLRAIARSSRLRTRRVALRDGWWKADSGPLLAYVEQDRRPVALLPSSSSSYVLHDPVARRRTRVSARVASTLSPFAYTFYRRFEDRALRARDLFSFGLRGCGRDVATVVVAGIAAGLLGLLTPLVTQVLFDQAIPGAQRSLLLQMAAGLLVAAVAAMLLQVAREIAVVRLSGKMDAAVQAAVVDRLLELPATFFRNYSAGDLGVRALGISAIRETLSRVALSALLTGISSLFSFGLLFYYEWRLALVACGLALALVVAVAISVTSYVRNQRSLEARAGLLSGTVLQLITGVAKLRVAGAEGRAFAFWAERFAEIRRVAFQAGLIGGGLTTFNAAYPVLASLAVFWFVALAMDPPPSIGTFVAFNTALGQFITGALTISATLISVVRIVPLYERARPILRTLPEVDARKADPGELSGAIEVSQVSFRYQANSPLVLNDVSLRVRPGEFVALVGPSGSGKSTLLRLLLGFEAPESGAILYDGRDLASLDVREVRRQVGTVLQNGRLMSGDIFTNIVGASALTQDDAWAAARMAGLEEDIREMPMGMFTVVSEGGSTLSGGQRQRLMIARAIVNKPRMIFFDEATSALDNRTQEIVSASLEGLAATRVVIAHRLSTVVNADRIHVLKEGRIVESGSYRELMQRRGLFADLARRQIA